ncbi:MAG: hypothetical protein J6A47_09045 [Bacilli bacterium]|nr:hypothetical protein [Bacilli bacterium]
MIQKLKQQNFLVLIPVLIMSCVAFVLTLVGVLLYTNNCASEFNGGKVSVNVSNLGLAAIIFAGAALLLDLLALFLSRSKKSASLFALSRIGNYGAFIFCLGAFLYEALDEYSLIGTIMYPIFSGTVGDPVEPLLVSSYFTSFAFLFVACFLSLAAGVTMRKKSHKIDAQPKEANVNE